MALEGILTAAPGEPQRLSIDGRAYLLRTPSHHDRIRYRRLLAASGAAYYGTAELTAALQDVCERVLPPTDAAAAVELIDAYRVAAKAYGDLVAEADDTDLQRPDVQAAHSELVAAELALSPHVNSSRRADPAYAAMLADNAVYWDLAGLLAARLAISGWEGLAAPCPPLPKDGHADATLQLIPQSDLPMIGLKFESMTRLSGAQRKNFATASPSSGAGLNSTALPAAQAAE